jgi:hypothetical protein
MKNSNCFGNFLARPNLLTEFDPPEIGSLKHWVVRLQPASSSSLPCPAQQVIYYHEPVSDQPHMMRRTVAAEKQARTTFGRVLLADSADAVADSVGESAA